MKEALFKFTGIYAIFHVILRFDTNPFVQL
jgi:hypothetical protein